MDIGLLSSDEKDVRTKKRQFYEELLLTLKESSLTDSQMTFLTRLVEIVTHQQSIIDLYDGSLAPYIAADLDYIREKLNIPVAEGQIVLLLCVWHDKLGPFTESYYPRDSPTNFCVDTVGQKLFSAVANIYGEPKSVESSHGMLLNLEHIQRQVFVLFGSYYEPEVRGKQRTYMLGVIAPQISQAESVQIREIFGEIGGFIKTRTGWKIKDYWKRIVKIIAPRPFHYFSR